MKNTLFILVLFGCDNSPQVQAPTDAAPDGAADAGSRPDLAHPPPDLSPPGDAAPADAGCPSGTLMDPSGACKPMQPPDACAAVHREFVAAGMSGYCGDCLAGFEDSGGTCMAPSGSDCRRHGDCDESAGLYCLQLDVNDSPKCRAAPCPDGQAWDRFGQKCETCPPRGEQPWPVSNRSGACYYQPAPGSFYDYSRQEVQPCDRDGDGWLNKEVGDELQLATSGSLDYTVLMNLRCTTLPVFTGAELHNEWGQVKKLTFADLKISARAVLLLETGNNDDPAFPRTPPLPAAAVNSLTKACGFQVDLNGNATYDVDEDQGKPQMTFDLVWTAPYEGLTYFTELYEGSFIQQPPTGGDLQLCDTCTPLPIDYVSGVISIRERSRCKGEVPITYSDSSSFWQDCTRRRDFSYSADDQTGYDFASYDCDAKVHGCSYDWPAVWAVPSAQPAPPPPLDGVPTGPLPPHGPCDVQLDPSEPWRGMTQYSQFLCANVQDPQTSTGNNVVPLTDVVAGKWQEDNCFVAPSPSPHMACAPVPSPSPGYMWLARRYQNYNSTTQYPGGCIDEGLEWSAMCAGSHTFAIGNDQAFGELLCGPPCFGSELMSFGSTWLCLHPTVTSGEELTGDLYTLRGEIPSSVGESGRMGSPGCSVDGGVCVRLE